MNKIVKIYENYILDKILDKINISGIDSLSKYEKDFLDKFSRNKSTKDAQKEMNAKVFKGEIGPYDAKLILYNIVHNDNSSVWISKLIINDIEYTGRILFQDENYLSGYFYNKKSDVFTDFEGLEYEIDSFLIESFNEAMKE